MIEYKSTSEGVIDPQRVLPVEDEYDVVVVVGEGSSSCGSPVAGDVDLTSGGLRAARNGNVPVGV